ncbi:MAG TPA: uracil-DNA glycosylase [Pedomonas sp.]|uniref:uracil-DNA glycosylase n=1 Tax=Pedomonas sp. TaxID=2976421 RepID=UPI002F3FB3CB
MTRFENDRIASSWRTALDGEFERPYMVQLADFLALRKSEGKTIFPQSDHIFRALELTPLDGTRVVILGQDPYHGPGQAHGLSFSVMPGVRVPPSLVNIYKELESDLGIARARHGFLESWARQGVLLLNSVLTVEQGQPASHRNKGWEKFTDTVIQKVNDRATPVVFLLWGSYAQKKADFVNSIDKGGHHLVLKAPHPSPLSAHSGFLGCRHFSQTNAFLEKQGLDPVDWSLPPVEAAAESAQHQLL